MNKNRIIILSLALLAVFCVSGCGVSNPALTDGASPSVSEPDGSEFSQPADDATAADQAEAADDESAGEEDAPQVATATDVKITISSLYKGEVGVKYKKKQLKAKGGSCGNKSCKKYIWEVQDLPKGLSLTDCGGNAAATVTAQPACIEGTPTEAGTKDVTIVATDEQDQTLFASKTLNLVVEEAASSKDDEGAKNEGVISKDFIDAVGIANKYYQSLEAKALSINADKNEVTYSIGYELTKDGGWKPDKDANGSKDRKLTVKAAGAYHFKLSVVNSQGVMQAVADAFAGDPDKVANPADGSPCVLGDVTVHLKQKEKEKDVWLLKVDRFYPRLVDPDKDPEVTVRITVTDDSNNEESADITLKALYKKDQPLSKFKFSSASKYSEDCDGYAANCTTFTPGAIVSMYNNAGDRINDDPNRQMNDVVKIKLSLPEPDGYYWVKIYSDQWFAQITEPNGKPPDAGSDGNYINKFDGHDTDVGAISIWKRVALPE